MKTRLLATPVLLGILLAASIQNTARAQAPLPTPGFHHLHLNSVDPDAAIAFYMRQFPSTSKTSWGGLPALASPNNVLVVFTKVNTPPIADPQATAFWHFGWHVTDVRKNMELYETRRHEVRLAPLYTTDEGGSVLVSSDTWPGTGGILGLTRAQIADARAKGTRPAGGAGFAYLRGPDDSLVEYQGNMPVERFNHIHMYQEDPFCAQVWYRTHLNAALPQAAAAAPRTQANCKEARAAERTWPALEKDGMFRAPSTGVIFGDVAMNWYIRQTDKPLLPTRGHLMDHVALSVTDLDAWVSKLRRESVRFLAEPYKIGDTRAVMIEGPSREAIELVEVRVR